MKKIDEKQRTYEIRPSFLFSFPPQLYKLFFFTEMLFLVFTASGTYHFFRILLTRIIQYEPQDLSIKALKKQSIQASM